MFIELHLLQNFAPSNLNRDDNNMPKDTVFGGVRRARVSSQSWKHAIRKSEVFKEIVMGSQAMRTSMLITELKKRMSNREAEDLDKIVPEFVMKYAGGLDKPPKGAETTDKSTKVMLFIGEDEVDDMAAVLNSDETWNKLLEAYAQKQAKAANKDESTETQSAATPKSSKKKEKDPFADELKKALDIFLKHWQVSDSQNPKDKRSVVGVAEIALFGRMLAAEGNNQTIEAACQVAHAISTHRVEMEMDYFTAMDDKLPLGAQGAGMLGQTDFNSSCYYRYARLDWDLLVTNLNGNTKLARRAVKGFLLAFAQVVPSGKQKPFAALNEPDFALATVRNRGMGWSLANAFEKAVRSDEEDGGYTKRSIVELDRYYGWLKRAYDHPEKSTIASTWVLVDSQDSLNHLKAPNPITNIYAWAESATKALTGMPEED